jgi:hypothetical protein
MAITFRLPCWPMAVQPLSGTKPFTKTFAVSGVFHLTQKFFHLSDFILAIGLCHHPISQFFYSYHFMLEALAG